ncbi:hypothetical protein GKODMF_14185 [Candidatus Electrothrix gigas]
MLLQSRIQSLGLSGITLVIRLYFFNIGNFTVINYIPCPLNCFMLLLRERLTRCSNKEKIDSPWFPIAESAILQEYKKYILILLDVK